MGWKWLVETYRLIGEDVSRSPSPAMMNAAFRAVGIDAVYEAVNVGRAEFSDRFLALRAETSGVNLTIPFKSDVIPLLDALDEVSARIGAVNVVARTGQRYKGYNTDVNGITAPLRERGMGRVRKALLLGAGGAARAFCEAMSQLGCAEITVAVRDAAKGERFASEMAGSGSRSSSSTGSAAPRQTSSSTRPPSARAIRCRRRSSGLSMGTQRCLTPCTDR